MKIARLSPLIHAGLLLGASGGLALAQDIAADAGNATVADFDLVFAAVTSTGDGLSFSMRVSGTAGATRPAATGALAGSEVFAYVWPTSLDPATVGFAGKAGILALAATAHPDFDDTPLEDESGDGDRTNDGDLWHSHWVVLGPDEACGPGALKVIDIPEGTSPTLPPTWPGLPLLIDSPGYPPQLSGNTITVLVPIAGTGLQYDAVTAGLRVSANMHAPLLCVADVFDVGSGDLSLPGRVE